MERKFRGLDFEGNWIYGDLVHDAYNGAGRTIKIGIQVPGYYPVEVRPETVGQSLGRKDSFKKDMYEGDIVDCRMSFEGGSLPHRGVLVYDNEFGAFATENLSGKTLLHNHCLNTFKVVGNKYENPDLIVEPF